MKIVLFYIIILMITTALLVKLAYLQRGYFAVGGEWLAWVIPVIIVAARSDPAAE